MAQRVVWTPVWAPTRVLAASLMVLLPVDVHKQSNRKWLKCLGFWTQVGVIQMLLAIAENWTNVSLSFFVPNPAFQIMKDKWDRNRDEIEMEKERNLPCAVLLPKCLKQAKAKRLTFNMVILCKWQGFRHLNHHLLFSGCVSLVSWNWESKWGSIPHTQCSMWASKVRFSLLRCFLSNKK